MVVGVQDMHPKNDVERIAGPADWLKFHAA
jgi:hypothetical protein